MVSGNFLEMLEVFNEPKDSHYRTIDTLTSGRWLGEEMANLRFNQMLATTIP